MMTMMLNIRIEECAKKLSLWHTPTFHPIMTHEELQPILESCGFVALPVAPPPPGGVACGEYVYSGAGVWPPERAAPTVRLPFPFVDGLHLLAYRAFFDALEFYLGPVRVPDLFHVRAVPIAQGMNLNRDRLYRAIRGCEIGDDWIFVYRASTLDDATKETWSHSSHDYNSNLDKDNAFIQSYPTAFVKNNSSNSICMIPI